MKRKAHANRGDEGALPKAPVSNKRRRSSTSSSTASSTQTLEQHERSRLSNRPAENDVHSEMPDVDWNSGDMVSDADLLATSTGQYDLTMNNRPIKKSAAGMCEYKNSTDINANIPRKRRKTQVKSTDSNAGPIPGPSTVRFAAEDNHPTLNSYASEDNTKHKVDEVAIWKEAREIKKIFNQINIDVIYRCLVERKNSKHRVNKVINDIMDGRLHVHGGDGTIDLTDEQTVWTAWAPHVNNMQDFQPGAISVEGDNATNNLEDSQPKTCTEDHNDIMQNVEEVSKLFPHVDPNHVYTMFELCKHDNRKESVINELTAQRNHKDVDDEQKYFHFESADIGVNVVVNPISLDVEQAADETAVDFEEPLKIHNNAENEDPVAMETDAEGALANDPLYEESLKISEMFPDIDRTEIFALLEAYYRRGDRIQIVSDELLQRQVNDQLLVDYIDFAVSPTANQCGDQSQSKENGAYVTSSGHVIMSQLEKDIEELKTIFPDCDPHYLYQSLETNANPDRVVTIAAAMFEFKNYPKLEDRLVNEKKQAEKNKILDMKFEIKEFLQLYEDPFKVFYDEIQPVSYNYKNHAIIQLRNTFPYIKVPHVEQVLNKHKGHFVPTLQELRSQVTLPGVQKSKQGKWYRKVVALGYVPLIPLPQTMDEIFFKEKFFAEHEKDIKDYQKSQVEALKRKEADHQKKMEEAKKNGELQECGCCFDDEVLFEEMDTCEDGHLFCNTCIKRSAESAIGDGKTKFPCLTSECDMAFSTSTLQKVLPPTVFSNLIKRMQEEEVKSAGIEDLESCPFCSFATIMPNPEDKVFKCLNEECLKESCRFCKEPNHIPLRCEEVEKQNETKTRTFIENKITESMLRTCYKCKKKFFKEEGCNKMTCTCGASMCYVCRAPIKDYSHFGDGPGQCAQMTDVFALHKREMEKAGLEAKKDMKKEGKSVNLKTDPMSLVKDYNQTKIIEFESDDSDDD